MRHSFTGSSRCRKAIQSSTRLLQRRLRAIQGSLRQVGCREQECIRENQAGPGRQSCRRSRFAHFQAQRAIGKPLAHCQMVAHVQVFSGLVKQASAPLPQASRTLRPTSLRDSVLRRPLSISSRTRTSSMVPMIRNPFRSPPFSVS